MGAALSSFVGLISAGTRGGNLYPGIVPRYPLGAILRDPGIVPKYRVGPILRDPRIVSRHRLRPILN